MVGIQNFRTAFSGFHKEDVARYLEYMNTKHQKQLNQLDTQIEELNRALEERNQANPTPMLEAMAQELEICRAQLQEQGAIRQALEAQMAELNVRLAAAEEEKAALAQQLSGTEEARAGLEQRCRELEDSAQAQPVAAAPAVQETPAGRETELDAYRRAQSIQRESQIQAQLLYYQANGVLMEAAAKVDDVAEEITGLADQVVRELTQLQVAVSGSKHALQDAATMMRAIRPNV